MGVLKNKGKLTGDVAMLGPSCGCEESPELGRHLLSWLLGWRRIVDEIADSVSVIIQRGRLRVRRLGLRRQGCGAVA